MIIATIINRRVFKSVEYASAFAISVGLVIFAAADWRLTPSFNPIGLGLVGTSVVADAILPNAQERNFRLGASRLEVTLYTNFFTLIAMTFTTLWSGDFFSVLKLASMDQHLAVFMMVYTAISYIAISLFMTIVKKYGGVTAVLLGTARKSMSLILSFLFFPKPFSWYYVLGATLVLGGLTVASLTKKLGQQQDDRIQYEPLKEDEALEHVEDNDVEAMKQAEENDVEMAESERTR
jgi:adenosine 3'-phospho 5'-phosphosulfate transporter B3